MLGDDDVANILTGTKKTDTADEILLRTLLNVASAGIGVTAAQGSE